MASIANRAGPTRIWKTIRGKKVKTNDGKDIGEIKKISETHLLLEQGKVHKHRFWIPKYVADAFDGKVLCLD
jgi:sporulation protein YlmC with PRC-barrel domain